MQIMYHLLALSLVPKVQCRGQKFGFIGGGLLGTGDETDDTLTVVCVCVGGGGGGGANRCVCALNTILSPICETSY